MFMRKMLPLRTAFMLILISWVTSLNADAQAMDHPDEPLGQKLFVSGEDGYHTYRIPAIAVTTRGTVLAVCEGRKNSRSDSEDIDLLYKRSTDHGKTWSEQQVIWDDRDNTCGNPCLVVDRETGFIWLLSTWNNGSDRESEIIDQTSSDTRRIFVLNSTDDGLSWSKPKEITAYVKRPDGDPL